MLRLRRLAVGCALGSAGATTAIVLVAKLDFAYRAPGLHVALETTAAITASAAAFLILDRFWRTGFLDELILAAGLSLLAISNLVFAALPAVFDLNSDRAWVWSTLFTGALAALFICVASLLPQAFSAKVTQVSPPQAENEFARELEILRAFAAEYHEARSARKD